MKNLGGLMKQAQALQKKMQDLQVELGERTVTAQAGGGMVEAESSRCRKRGDVHNSSGCQIRRKAIKQLIAMTAAPMSTIQGLM